MTPVADARRIDAAEKRRRALSLRKAGLTYEQIAQTPRDKARGDMRPLFSSRGRAHEAVAAVLRAVDADAAEDASVVRDLELARLDDLQAGVWKRAVTGDADAVSTVLRVMERRTKLLGLDFADGLDERYIQVHEAEAQRAQEAFEAALREVGMGDEQVQDVFGRLARRLDET